MNVSCSGKERPLGFHIIYLKEGKSFDGKDLKKG